MITIKRASIEDLEQIIPLFDAYRVFYEQTSDTETARKFLKTRLENNQSVIFLAAEEDRAIGFTQLYPMYSSVSMEEMYVLNDLFVKPSARGKGVGEKLLLQAQAYAHENNLKGLTLETASDNPAQRLYERLGWKRDASYYHYFWKS